MTPNRRLTQWWASLTKRWAGTALAVAGSSPGLWAALLVRRRSGPTTGHAINHVLRRVGDNTSGRSSGCSQLDNQKVLIALQPCDAVTSGA